MMNPKNNFELNKKRVEKFYSFFILINICIFILNNIMTPEQFVIWLKGFVVASNNYNLTPKAWDELKEQLNKVNSSISQPLKSPGIFPYEYD